MNRLLKVVGAGWALIGVGNMVLGTSNVASDSPASGVIIAFVWIFNVVLFVFPGLVLYALGMRTTGKS